MTYVAEASPIPNVAPQSEARFALDVALGVIGEPIHIAVALVEGVTRWAPLRSRARWRPAYLPARLQPASLVADLARRGAQHREWATGRVDRELDRWTPVLVEQVVSRLDLTGLVTHHVDLAAIVEDVIAAVDLPAIIRESTGSMASETVRGARMTGISIDEAISRSLERHRVRRRSTNASASTTVDAP